MPIPSSTEVPFPQLVTSFNSRRIIRVDWGVHSSMSRHYCAFPDAHCFSLKPTKRLLFLARRNHSEAPTWIVN
jgi:hypothetical protein